MSCCVCFETHLSYSALDGYRYVCIMITPGCELADRIIKIRKRFPFWNSSGGRRSILFSDIRPHNLVSAVSVFVLFFRSFFSTPSVHTYTQRSRPNIKKRTGKKKSLSDCTYCICAYIPSATAVTSPVCI